MRYCSRQVRSCNSNSLSSGVPTRAWTLLRKLFIQTSIRQTAGSTDWSFTLSAHWVRAKKICNFLSDIVWSESTSSLKDDKEGICLYPEQKKKKRKSENKIIIYRNKNFFFFSFFKFLKFTQYKRLIVKMVTLNEECYINESGDYEVKEEPTLDMSRLFLFNNTDHFSAEYF